MGKISGRCWAGGQEVGASVPESSIRVMGGGSSEGWPPALTFRAWSLSSLWPRSLPLACTILFPDTRFPTITEAGPISGKKMVAHVWGKHTWNPQKHEIPPCERAYSGEILSKMWLWKKLLKQFQWGHYDDNNGIYRLRLRIHRNNVFTKFSQCHSSPVFQLGGCWNLLTLVITKKYSTRQIWNLKYEQ